MPNCLPSTVITAGASLNVFFGVTGLQAAEAIMLHVFLGLLILIATSALVFWREELIESRREGKRLDGMVVRLSQANVQSQDFARDVQEIAMENERKRITRDIHDVVGYTLTNNIMMMEAAIVAIPRSGSIVPPKNSPNTGEQIAAALPGSTIIQTSI